MDLTDRKSALRVAAGFAAKQAVELAMTVSELAERLGESPRYLTELNERDARRKMAAIRTELDTLEKLLGAEVIPLADALRLSVHRDAPDSPSAA
jgi:hypothetical protein